MDLSTNFEKEFDINGVSITSPGMYAVSYSLPHEEKEKGHGISRLVEYGRVQLNH